jgi:hypothetical protein
MKCVCSVPIKFAKKKKKKKIRGRAIRGMQLLVWNEPDFGDFNEEVGMYRSG